MQIHYQRLRLPWLSIGQSLRARLGRGEEHRDRKFERRGALPDADPAHGALLWGGIDCHERQFDVFAFFFVR